jgi:hypothetical protein
MTDLYEADTRREKPRTVVEGFNVSGQKRCSVQQVRAKVGNTALVHSLGPRVQ